MKLEADEIGINDDPSQTHIRFDPSLELEVDYGRSQILPFPIVIANVVIMPIKKVESTVVVRGFKLEPVDEPSTKKYQVTLDTEFTGRLKMLNWKWINKVLDTALNNKLNETLFGARAYPVDRDTGEKMDRRDLFRAQANAGASKRTSSRRYSRAHSSTRPKRANDHWS